MTINIAAMTRVAPSAQHGALASARVPFIPANTAAASLQQAATALGLSNVGANQFQGPDGSWVALVNNRLERGFGNVVFQGRPVDLAALPVAAAGACGTVAATQLPATSTNAAQLSADLVRLGFTQPDPNIGYHVHPDQSWVVVQAGGPLLRGYGQQQVNPADGPAARPAPAPAAAAPAAAPPAPAPAAAAGPLPAVADDVMAYPKIPPTFPDGFLASAAFPFLQPANLATDRATFLSRGFKEVSPGLFEHKDTSWVSYTSAQRIERGHGKQTFATVPLSPVSGRMAAMAPQMISLGLAVGNPAIANLTPTEVENGAKALTDAGFTATRPSFYQHADGSFISEVAGKVYFGQGQQLFTGPPNLQTLLAALPQVAVDINAVQAAVSLWAMPGDPAGAKAHLLGLGFVEQPAGYFMQAQTQLWVAIDHTNTLHCGLGGSRYASVPTPAQLPQIASAPAHGWLAIANAHQVAANSPTLQADLTALGFVAGKPGLFTHPDGSWVALTNQQLVRGHLGTVFSDVPTPPPPGTVRPFPQFQSVPPGTWGDWANVHNFACARLPIWGQLNQAQVTMVLGHLGFVQQPNQPGFWKHPDGSEVHLAWNQIPTHQATKFQAFDFGQFPYNRQVPALPNTKGIGRDWNTMTQDTQKWLAWVQNPAASPPPWPAFNPGAI